MKWACLGCLRRYPNVVDDTQMFTHAAERSLLLRLCHLRSSANFQNGEICMFSLTYILTIRETKGNSRMPAANMLSALCLSPSKLSNIYKMLSISYNTTFLHRDCLSKVLRSPYDGPPCLNMGELRQEIRTSLPGKRRRLTPRVSSLGSPP